MPPTSIYVDLDRGIRRVVTGSSPPPSESFVTQPLPADELWVPTPIGQVIAATNPGGGVGVWGEFPTLLNSGWADWHLNEAPLTGSAAYVQPPALPELPSVPVGAVQVNPSNIESQVASQPSGTAFVLDPGVYNMTVPTKGGNEYWGNPGNWESVRLDGNNSLQTAFDRGDHGVKVRYLTMQHYYGYPNTKSNNRGTIWPGDNWDMRGIIGRWNQRTAFHSGPGANGYLAFIVAYQNGQYGFGGNFSGWVLDCAEVYHNGYGAMLPPDVDRYEKSDRGGCKLGQGGPFTGRRIHSWGHDKQGWWYDIRVEDYDLEYSWIEGNEGDGCRWEAGRGPGVCRFSRFEDNAWNMPSGSWWSDYYAGIPAQIALSTISDMNVYGNVCRGHRGLGLYNWAHPQLTGEASTPGAGTINASSAANNLFHHNAVILELLGRPLEFPDAPPMAAGLTQLSTSHPNVDDAHNANNDWQDNVYSSLIGGPYFQWTPNRELTLSEWQSYGLQ